MVVNTKDRYENGYTSVSQDINTNDVEKYEKCEEEGPVIGMRHLQTSLYFALGCFAYGFRVCLSVGIVAMTDPLVSSNPNIPTYPNWKRKNVILSAFFWGYILPQVFAAYLAKKYGAKWFLIGTMLLQSLLSVLTPFIAANFGEIGMMLARALQGFCQGFMQPSLTHLMSQWVPPQERSRLGSFVYTAGKSGTVFAILVTGFIAASWYGWPMAFYLFGVLGIVWCILMAIFGFDSPRSDPRISVAERHYIEEHLGYTEDRKHHKTPWLKIVTSVPIWALLAAQTGSIYCFSTLLTQIPTYMNYVMNFDMKNNSIWSAMPYLAFWLLSFFFSMVSDYIVNNGILTRNVGRKVFTSIGLLIPALALITLGFTNSDQSTLAVVLLIIAVGFNSACYSGYAVNHMDLSLNHAATIMGLVNGIAHITAVVAPLIVEVIVSNDRDPLQWRHVFFLAAGVNILTSTIFNIFGSAETQQWNTDGDRYDKEKQ